MASTQTNDLTTKQKVVTTVIIILLITGCNRIMCSSSEPDQVKVVNEKKPLDSIKGLYDLPALRGKTIDEIRKLLQIPKANQGEPTDVQVSQQMFDWEDSIEKEGYTLLVTFKSDSRKVVDFFISKQIDGMTAEYVPELLKVCGVEETNTDFEIKPVRTIKDPTKITGVIIKPL